MSNAVLIQDSEGFLHIRETGLAETRARKLYKLYCHQCGSIFVTANPDDYLYFDGEHYLCYLCNDDIPAVGM